MNHPKTLDCSPGSRFGRLVMVRQVERSRHGVRWLCRCDCGVELERDQRKLLSQQRLGRQQSCAECRAMLLRGARRRVETTPRRANGPEGDHAMSIPEIAEVLGVSPQAVSQCLERALIKLRRRLAFLKEG